MSRIGLKPIEIPEGVEVKIENNTVHVKGPKGELSKTFSEKMKINLDDKVITVEREDDDKESRSLHGTTRSLIHNMVKEYLKASKKN